MVTLIVMLLIITLFFPIAAQGRSSNHCDQDHCEQGHDNIENIKQENNFDFAEFCIDLIAEIMSYPVIWRSKLQPCTTSTILFLTYLNIQLLLFLYEKQLPQRQ